MIPDELEQRLLRDAARTLVKHEGSLCEAYPQVLLAEFAQAISGGSRKPGSLSFDSLELMGDEQMQESVDLLRLQQVVLAEVEADLTELNALVCAVQGLRSVQPDRNPLRPEVYVRSVRTVVLQSPVPHAVRHRWMQHWRTNWPRSIASCAWCCVRKAWWAQVSIPTLRPNPKRRLRGWPYRPASC